MINKHIPYIVIISLLVILFVEKENIMQNFRDREYGFGVVELGYGTGFFVNEQNIITNEHVVRDCKTIKITEPKQMAGTLELIAVDEYNDLAALRSTTKPQNLPILREINNIKQGEVVSIIGYPQEEYAFKKAFIVNPDEQTPTAEGAVEQRITFTDAVRKGNSGGPLLDSIGNVIGVIESYMEVEETYYVEKDGKEVVSNTQKNAYGAAVHMERLKSFLERYNIQYYTANRYEGFLPDASLEKYANEFIVKIRCVKNKHTS